MLNKPILTFFVLLLLSPFEVFGESPSLKRVNIAFYTENIVIPYSDDVITSSPRKLEEEDIVAFYKRMNRSSYRTIIQVITKSKQRYQLNDWLTYELLKRSIEVIYQQKPKSYKILATWFFMSKLN